jgi:hypothetical protein
MNTVRWESSVWATPEIDGEFTGGARKDEAVGFFEFGVTELTVSVRLMGCKSSGKHGGSSYS